MPSLWAYIDPLWRSYMRLGLQAIHCRKAISTVWISRVQRKKKNNRNSILTLHNRGSNSIRKIINLLHKYFEYKTVYVPQMVKLWKNCSTNLGTYSVWRKCIKHQEICVTWYTSYIANLETRILEHENR